MLFRSTPYPGPQGLWSHLTTGSHTSPLCTVLLYRPDTLACSLSPTTCSAAPLWRALRLFLWPGSVFSDPHRAGSTPLAQLPCPTAKFYQPAQGLTGREPIPKGRGLQASRTWSPQALVSIWKRAPFLLTLTFLSVLDTWLSSSRHMVQSFSI